MGTLIYGLVFINLLWIWSIPCLIFINIFFIRFEPLLSVPQENNQLWDCWCGNCPVGLDLLQPYEIVLMFNFWLALTNLLHRAQKPGTALYGMDGDLITKPEPWGLMCSIKRRECFYRQTFYVLTYNAALVWKQSILGTLPSQDQHLELYNKSRYVSAAYFYLSLYSYHLSCSLLDTAWSALLKHLLHRTDGREKGFT